MVVWLQAKVRECWLRLRLRRYAVSVSHSELVQHLALKSRFCSHKINI